ncbi:hypothetical protein HerbRD11066_47390 [Herbidospora sp. RD11066]
MSLFDTGGGDSVDFEMDFPYDSDSGYVRFERWSGLPPCHEACTRVGQGRVLVPSGVVEVRNGFDLDVPGYGFDLEQAGAQWSIRVDRHIIAELPMLTYFVIRFWP